MNNEIYWVLEVKIKKMTYSGKIKQKIKNQSVIFFSFDLFNFRWYKIENFPILIVAHYF